MEMLELLYCLTCVDVLRCSEILDVLKWFEMFRNFGFLELMELLKEILLGIFFLALLTWGETPLGNLRDDCFRIYLFCGIYFMFGFPHFYVFVFLCSCFLGAGGQQ